MDAEGTAFFTGLRRVVLMAAEAAVFFVAMSETPELIVLKWKGMRVTGIVAAVVCAFALRGQSVPAPGVAAGQELAREIERVKEMVAAGVAAPSSLRRLEAQRDDLRDEALLRETLYGQLAVEDLSPEQADEMVGAATRRVDRRRGALEEARARVEAGAASRLSLTPFLEDLDRTKRALDEAESRARLLKEISEIARREAEFEQASGETPLVPYGPLPVAEKYDGAGELLPVQWRETVLRFEAKFGRGLPVSAKGETAFHKALGYDHRGRVDVAIDPDSEPGQWLRRHLESMRVPYFLFRAAVPGKASAAHIHIGPPSLRLRRAD